MRLFIVCVCVCLCVCVHVCACVCVAYLNFNDQEVLTDHPPRDLPLIPKREQPENMC